MEVQRKYPDLLIRPKDRKSDFYSVMIEFKYLKKGEENMVFFTENFFLKMQLFYNRTLNSN